MESMDYWRLCDELSVIQATLLLIGCDPSGEFGYADNWEMHERPKGYVPAKSALTHDILSGKLPATIRRSAWERGWDEEPGDGEIYSSTVHIFGNDITSAGVPDIRASIPGESIRSRGVIYRAEPDWNLTTVRVDQLRDWLAKRGFRTGFFFPSTVDDPDYLDPQHPRYAPKLAAAVRAWLAVDDPKGKHPKQALLKWLRENSADFDLTDEDGNPIEQSVDDCAKVANWQPTGGAPKTPGA